MIRAPDALRRTARQPKLPAARGPARLVLQAALYVAWFVGSFGGATVLLSGDTEPFRRAMEALGSPAPAREVAFTARLNDWPEIKDGLPELRQSEPTRRAEPVAPVPAPLPVGEATHQRLTTAERSEAPGPVEGADEGVQVTGAVDPSPVALNDRPDETAPSSQAEAAEPAGKAGSSAGHAVASASAPRAAEAGGESYNEEPRKAAAAAPRREARDGQEAKANAPLARPTVAGRTIARAVRKAKTKPAIRLERKRVASAAPAAAPEDVAPAVPAEPNANPTPQEGVPVLGEMLASGRRMRECLLDFRC